MSEEITIQLSLPTFSYVYDEKTERLYISGAALEEGMWKDMYNHTFFYPRDVIKESAYGFKNHDLVCEHLNLPIGKITDVVLTDMGFAIKDAYVTHKPSIKAILSGTKRGLSIKANVILNPVTNVIEKIWNQCHIALVASPACKTCNIDHVHTDKGIVIMSSEENAEGEVVEQKPEDEIISSDTVDVPVEGTVVEDVVIDSADVSIETPPNIEVDTPTSVPSPEVVPIVDPAIDELKVSLSAATAKLVEMETVSVQLSAITKRLQELEASLSDTKVELSSTKLELEQKTTESIDYKSKVDELQTIIDTRNQADRNQIISDIKTFDPEIDASFIDSMTNVQLSAYKGTVERYASKGIIGEKRSVKVDASTSLSAPAPKLTLDELPHDVIANAGLKYLKSFSKGK